MTVKSTILMINVAVVVPIQDIVVKTNTIIDGGVI